VSLVLLIPPVLLVPLVSPWTCYCEPSYLRRFRPLLADPPRFRIRCHSRHDAVIADICTPYRGCRYPQSWVTASRGTSAVTPASPERATAAGSNIVCQNSPTRGVVTPNHERHRQRDAHVADESRDGPCARRL